MNSVHESGLNGDSKTALSRKLGRKLNRVHKTPNWPSWHPGAPMAAHRGCVMAGSRPYRGRGPGRVAGSAVVSQAQLLCRRLNCRVVALRARASCPAPSAVSQHPSVVLQRPSGRVATPQWPCRKPCRAPLAVSWGVRALLCALCCASCSPGTLYCDTVSQQPNCPSCNTIPYCNIIFSLPSLNLCNTIFVLQHTSSKPAAIHFLSLNLCNIHHTIAIHFFAHNIIWAVAQFNFSAPKFFFSHLFSVVGKITKITENHFFFLDTQ